MNYQLTNADVAPVPASYFTEPRYLGYREANQKKPYAKYFSERPLPVQPHVKDALLVGPVSGAYGPRLSTLADELSRPGSASWKPASPSMTMGRWSLRH